MPGKNRSVNGMTVRRMSTLQIVGLRPGLFRGSNCSSGHRRLLKDQLKQTIVDSAAHDVGFTARHNWTLEIIAAFIKREFGQTYSLRGISKMMHRQGLSYTKPTYTLAAADEE